MKILHICINDFGGAGLCCIRIHQSLLDAGVDSKVIVLNQSNKSISEVYQYGNRTFVFIEKLLIKILKITNLVFHNKTSKRFFLGTISKTNFRSFTDVTNCQWYKWADVIHLHWVNSYIDYPSFFRKNTKPLVWTLHDENLFYGIAHYSKDVVDDDPIENLYREKKNNLITPLTNINIVFLSEYMRDKFAEHPIVNNKRQIVINNSVNGEVFNIKDRKNLRRKFDIPLDKVIIGFVSYNIYDPRKGLVVLQNALKRLDNSDNIIVLAIGGNPNQVEVPPNVLSVGMVENTNKLSCLLSCCNFLAMPSFQEAFAQSPMEAMSCGLPVIAFPCSGTKELIKEHNGIICRDFTEDALVDGLHLLLKREYSPIEIRKDVLHRFSPRTISNKYIKLYRDILQLDTAS